MKNAVILNKDASTWPRIKKYWEEMWISTLSFKGTDIGEYYGVIDGRFGAYERFVVEQANAEIIELPDEENLISICARCGGTGIIANGPTCFDPCPCGANQEPKEEKKYPEYPKPILRKAYEIIGRLKAENLRRAGFNYIEISSYLDADKDLKEIESHLNK